MKNFIEYIDNGDNYEPPERHDEGQVLDIRLYCFTGNGGCNTYIKGKEGYNGSFVAETGQYADLRNQSFVCQKHIKEKIIRKRIQKINKIINKI